MIRCLSRDELAQVLDSISRKSVPESPELALWLDYATAWQDEVIGFNYFLAQILLAMKRDGIDYRGALSAYFSIGDGMWFTAEEFDTRFIAYMMANSRDVRLTLAEDLLDLGRKMRCYQYDKTIRL
jgi:hypothetical protein